MGRAGRSLASEYSVENCAKAVLDMVNGLLHVSSGEALVVSEGN
jgi:hypothetical protein